MSYYSQHNAQRKSIGVFIVIAFHVLLITALVNGLGVKIYKTLVEKPIIIKTVETPPIAPVNQKAPEVTTKPFDKIDKPIDIDFVITQTNPVRPSNPPIAPSNDGSAMSGFSKAIIKKAPKPIYPNESTRLGEQGSTGMRISIDTTGRVTNAIVVSSSGSERLDQAAIKHAMRNWLFNPCVENGQAVACEQNMKLTWKLEEAR